MMIVQETGACLELCEIYERICVIRPVVAAVIAAPALCVCDDEMRRPGSGAWCTYDDLFLLHSSISQTPKESCRMSFGSPREAGRDSDNLLLAVPVHTVQCTVQCGNRTTDLSRCLTRLPGDD
nr:hypothetical protein CFP56_55924 [Quercus suber]